MHKYTVCGSLSLARNRGCRAAKYAEPGLITARGAADMDGYQGLPTSHSIRAYLAVLYRL
jgi:hypothetical protein